MRLAGLGIVLCVSLALPGVGEAARAPAPARAWSFAIESDASQRIVPLAREELVRDEVFVDTLKGVLGGPLSVEAKTDAFTLMLDKIGWLFAGSVRLFPGQGYLGTFHGRLATYFVYQEELAAFAEQATGFAALAGSTCGVNAVRCSSALMLTALLDRERAAVEVRRMIAEEAHRSAEVPEIVVHALAVASGLSRAPAVAVDLAALLPRITSEESREDVICALAIFASADATAEVTAFLEGELRVRNDNAVETGLFVARQRLGPSRFQTWYAGVKMQLGPERAARLEELGLEGTRLPMQDFGSAPVKIWDGFDVTLYDDGLQTRKGGFSYFRGR
jgi:hypothetical protein